MSDQSQRTEQPTPRRLKKAREEGQFPVSRELLVGAQAIGAVYLLTTFGSQIVQSGGVLLRGALRSAFTSPLSPESLKLNVSSLLLACAWPCAYGLMGLTLASLAVQVISTHLGIAPQRLRPDFTRLNPAQRIQGLVGQNVVAAVTAIAALFGSVFLLYTIAWSRADLVLLSLGSLPAALQTSAHEIKGLLWKGAFGLGCLGVAHYFYQRHTWRKRLRMSKQEVRDEHKESESSPEIKMRLRRIRRDLLRRQMMREVPKATAIVTNPTHYAVAIRYEVNGMAAPQVIAKGKNYLALRIREKAKVHDIPIVENPPLAQALYKSVDVGQEIPPHLYRAVAEILAYIFRLMNTRKGS